MKKLCCFILIIVLITVVFSANYGSIRGNNKRCMDAAQRISNLNGIDAVAVLKRQDRILAGIRLDKEDAAISNKVRSILNGLFPNIKEFQIEVSNGKAEQIIELSYFADSDMQKSVIDGRFEFLWNN